MSDSWIPTATGGRIFLDPIDLDRLKLRDISLGLARMSRFNGQYSQLKQFYSVAEHCIWASHIAPMGHQLAALVHDAAEALIGDVTSPLKAMLPDYRAFEARFEAALRKHFGWPDWHNPIVKKADLEMLAIEQQTLVTNRSAFECLNGIEPPNVKLECWLPTMAWVVWEDRYKELKGRGY